jgi:hypothetical protein
MRRHLALRDTCGSVAICETDRAGPVRRPKSPCAWRRRSCRAPARQLISTLPSLRLMPSAKPAKPISAARPARAGGFCPTATMMAASPEPRSIARPCRCFADIARQEGLKHKPRNRRDERVSTVSCARSSPAINSNNKKFKKIENRIAPAPRSQPDDYAMIATTRLASPQASDGFANLCRALHPSLYSVSILAAIHTAGYHPALYWAGCFTAMRLGCFRAESWTGKPLIPAVPAARSRSRSRRAEPRHQCLRSAADQRRAALRLKTAQAVRCNTNISANICQQPATHSYYERLGHAPPAQPALYAPVNYR